MIGSVIKIGENILNNNFSKINVLKKISIKPKLKNRENIDIHPIIFDFNLNNHAVEIRRGEQFQENEDYFIFSKLSSNAKRIALNTNNYNYLLIHDNKNGPTPRGIKLFAKDNNLHLSESFNQVLDELMSFYYNIEVSKKNKSNFLMVLNPNKLVEDDKKIFFDYLRNENKTENNGLNQENLLNDEKVVQKAYDHLIWYKLGIKNNKDYPIYAFLYINGKNIFETEFKEEYSNFCYYAYIGLMFNSKNGIKNKKCYYCNKITTVTNNVSSYFKFYVVDKKGFFQDLTIENAYKSFSLCETCYVKYLAGVNFVKNNLKSSYLGTSFVVVPKSESFFKDFRENCFDLMKTINSEIGNKEIRDVLKKSTQEDNYLIDFLFYEAQNNYFKVIKSLSDVELKHILRIKKVLDLESYELKTKFPYLSQKYDLNLRTFQDILFSNFKGDVSKSILFDLFEYLFENIPFEKDILYEQFLQNYKKGYFDDKKRKNNYFHTFEMFYLLKVLIKLNLIVVRKMEIDNFSKINNKDLIEFFKDHEEIDELRKGFVVLGYLINKIIAKQQKEKKTSTFLSKIDFDGMDKIELKDLMNEIDNYFNIYKDIYRESDLETFASETISKYINESNSISSSEITFYILLGVHLGEYLGKSKSKKEGESNGTE